VRLIDTAGMRKKARVVDKLEKLAVADARHAVDFAEVVVLLLDATRGLEHQDLKIASMVLEEGRALIVAINKWDVAEDASGLFNGIAARSMTGWRRCAGLPVLAVSARTGKGLDDPDQRRVRDPREPGRSACPPRRSTAGSTMRWKPIRRRRRAASGSSCATSPRPRPARRASSCSAPGWTSCRKLPRYLVNGIRRELGFDAVPVRLTLRSAKNPFRS
jgi:GTP-binding protein